MHDAGRLTPLLNAPVAPKSNRVVEKKQRKSAPDGIRTRADAPYRPDEDPYAPSTIPIPLTGRAQFRLLKPLLALLRGGGASAIIFSLLKTCSFPSGQKQRAVNPLSRYPYSR